VNKLKNIKNKYLRKYIIKFLKGIKIHDKEFYKIVCFEENLYDNVELVDKIEEIINEINIFGGISRKYYYSLCQCILYGIKKKEILFISMNSNALIKHKNILRDKPQYVQIKNIDKILKDIEKRINIPIKYISILPDYSKDYPFELYEEQWEKNKKYLEIISNKNAYRLSEIYQKDLTVVKQEIKNNIDIIKLNELINYYENNNFIKLGFAAPSNFQREQILSYMITGYILEKVLPFSILLDVQKKNFPFEQKFYNYARKNNLPIIFCGQKY